MTRHVIDIIEGDDEGNQRRLREGAERLVAGSIRGMSSRTPKEPMWDDEPKECPRCGEVHLDHRGNPGCSGHRTSDGAPCTKVRRKGQSVCDTHGGRAPQNLAAGERRQAEDQARRELRKIGVAREQSADPGVILLELIAVSQGTADYYLQRVQETPEDRLVFGVVETKTEADGQMRLTFGSSHDDDEYEDEDDRRLKTGLIDFGSAPASEVKAKAGANVWLQLWNEEREKLAKWCKLALDAGVQERRVRMAEREGQVIYEVLTRAAAALVLTAEQRARLPHVMDDVLRQVAGERVKVIEG